ncbi:MAG: thioredoxin family protein [Gammaproteobacteria bacterium]|nr:thioredoxin family protein [Gammaproteobacteria bacterium]
MVLSFQRFIFTSLLLLWTLLFSDAAISGPPADYPFNNYDNGLAAAKQNNKYIFIYYGREGCGYCDKTNKESFSQAKVKQVYLNHYNLVYIDAEGGNRITLPNGEVITEMQFGPRIKALVTPVFIFLEPSGKEIVKVPGFQSERDLLNLHAYVEGEHYKTKTFNQFLEKKN